MSQTQRQQEIVALVKDKGFISIDELVDHFKVTPQTIRRDLNQLADAKKVKRLHGGAGSSSSTVNAPYQSRKIMHLTEKERIAQLIAQSIPNGSSLFINIGTTTETIARALLNHKDLRVVTNNIHVASILSAKQDFTVIIAAGEVRHRDGGIVGEATSEFISQFQMDYGIIGISGISHDGVLLDFDYREVKVAQAIIEHSQHVFLAADNSKFGRSAMVRLGTINQIDALFTDAPPPEQITEMLAESNIPTHIA